MRAVTPYRAEKRPTEWVILDGYGETIARAMMGNKAGDNDFATAVLLAAAPDLFDMLRAAVARVELANSKGDSIMSAWLPRARAALAKATREEAES